MCCVLPVLLESDCVVTAGGGGGPAPQAPQEAMPVLVPAQMTSAAASCCGPAGGSGGGTGPTQRCIFFSPKKFTFSPISSPLFRLFRRFFAKWALFFARVSYLATAADTVSSTRRCCILCGPLASTAADIRTAAAGSGTGHLCSHQYRYRLQRSGRRGPPASTCGDRQIPIAQANTQHTSVGATIESIQQSNRTCGRFRTCGMFRATIESKQQSNRTCVEISIEPVMINIRIEHVGVITCAGAGSAI